MLPSHGFIVTLKIWELEEIECVYYHLRGQAQIWANDQSPHHSPELASRLLVTYGPPRNAWEYSHTHQDSYDESFITARYITYFIGFYRELLWGCRDPTAVTEWPDTQDANRPNAGWECLENDEKAMRVREGYLRVASVGCFLDWRYYIWDRSRLEAWWLVVPEKKDLSTDKEMLERWTYGQSKRRDCEHCGRSFLDAGSSGSKESSEGSP